MRAWINIPRDWLCPLKNDSPLAGQVIAPTRMKMRFAGNCTPSRLEEGKHFLTSHGIGEGYGISGAAWFALGKRAALSEDWASEPLSDCAEARSLGLCAGEAGT